MVAWNIVKSYTGNIVNGLRFYTTFVVLSQNSGVFYEATSKCRSTAKKILPKLVIGYHTMGELHT